MDHRNKLLRRTPLRRKKRMRQRRATPRRSGRVRDRGYLLAVKQLPCLLADDFWTPCEGQVEADHAGLRPLGRKCSDDEAIPLCRLHHRQRTDGMGLFWGMPAAAMRMWLTTAIAETQARVAGRAA